MAEVSARPARCRLQHLKCRFEGRIWRILARSIERKGAVVWVAFAGGFRIFPAVNLGEG